MTTNWKSLLSALALALLLTSSLAAQEAPVRYVEAAELTLVGKLMDTPNPYSRVDTTRFGGFTPIENKQVRCAAGLAVAFRTNSPFITIQIARRPSYESVATTPMATAGFDLYIREGRQWIWAENVGFRNGDDGPSTLIRNMDGTAHDCLLYLPTHTELHSLQLGVAPESTLEPLENPFRGRIVFCGSSFTHGSGASRPGLSYPMVFERHTGLQVLSLGCGGNGRLQPQFAEVLAGIEADAFVFDQFSNPTPDQLRTRFFPFLERIRAAHPGTPIIFQQTIVREKGNFDRKAREANRTKMALTDSLMAVALQRYPDVYYLKPSAADGTHEWSVDGTHPDDYGYYLWSRSIEKPVLKILRRYGRY